MVPAEPAEPAQPEQPEQPQPAEQAIERRIVTVLFADLVGFTSLSERLDPEDVAAVQDAYFGAVRDTIARYGGALEKFIGDAAMAVFGIPLTRDDDALRGVRAGLALVSAVEQLGPRMGLDEAALQLRVGINTGEVIHAEAGADRGRVTGDTVNLAARLQTAAAPGSVCVGELTSLSVSESVELEPMGALELKGKAQAVRAWTATGLRADPSRQHALGTLHAPLLGRTDELRRLTDAVGTTARWAIVAPPGVGKSRLLAEFGAVADAKATVLRARVRADVVAPYEPVAQLLRAALEVRDLQPALSRLAPERAAVVREEVEATLSPAAARGDVSHGLADEREARFAAWTEALDALAGDTPSVWVIEDVHWAGGDLLAFLAHAGRAASSAGRLIVATARPSLLERAPEWCAPSADTVVMDLSPLAAIDSAALVRALVGDALPAGLLNRVAERSDGNALFIEELLRTWIAVGTLAPDDESSSGWRLAIPATDVPMPATVQAIYAAQLDDLPSDARLVARRGSVAGRRFSVDALAPLEVPSPQSGLDVLRQLAFVAGPHPDPLAGEVYAYRHALLRDAGYASLSRAAAPGAGALAGAGCRPTSDRDCRVDRQSLRIRPRVDASARNTECRPGGAGTAGGGVAGARRRRIAGDRRPRGRRGAAAASGRADARHGPARPGAPPPAPR